MKTARHIILTRRIIDDHTARSIIFASFCSTSSRRFSELGILYQMFGVAVIGVQLQWKQKNVVHTWPIAGFPSSTQDGPTPRVIYQDEPAPVSLFAHHVRGCPLHVNRLSI